MRDAAQIGTPCVSESESQVYDSTVIYHALKFGSHHVARREINAPKGAVKERLRRPKQPLEEHHGNPEDQDWQTVQLDFF